MLNNIKSINILFSFNVLTLIETSEKAAMQQHVFFYLGSIIEKRFKEYKNKNKSKYGSLMILKGSIYVFVVEYHYLQAVYIPVSC